MYSPSKMIQRVEYENCVVTNYYKLGWWDDEFCTEKFHAACQVPYTLFVESDLYPPCPDGFTDIFPNKPEVWDQKSIFKKFLFRLILDMKFRIIFVTIGVP